MKNSKAIRIAVIILGLVLSVSLIYNYKYTKNINESYNSLLIKESKEFRAFQGISNQVSGIQRSLLNIAIVPPNEYDKWQKKIEKCQFKIDSQFHNLEMIESGPAETTNIAKLKQSYTEYKNQYTKLMVLLLAEDFEGTHQVEKIKEVSASYEGYMKQQKNMLNIFSQNLEDQSNVLQSEATHTSELFLLIGTLPYLLILISLI